MDPYHKGNPNIIMGSTTDFTEGGHDGVWGTTDTSECVGRAVNLVIMQTDGQFTCKEREAGPCNME